ISSMICGDTAIKNATTSDQNIAYIDYYTEEGIQEGIQEGRPMLDYIYNQYIFCKLFVSNEEDLDNRLAKSIINEDSFSSLDETKGLFYKTKILADIFKAKDCSSFETIALLNKFIQFLPEIAKNELSNFDLEGVCNLMTSSQVKEDMVNEFCDNNSCFIFLTRDINLCEQIEDMGKKSACRNFVRYLQAMSSNDRNYCLEIDHGFYSIACQSYFIDTTVNMCDKIAYEIHEICSSLKYYAPLLPSTSSCPESVPTCLEE
ncbi:hypothetical protein KKH35_02200, partial [Patescibacteria group bacterium]|nr:hypothetical protein [Patescibacteria group bacterium]